MSKPRNVADLVERLSHYTYGENYRAGLKPAQWSALRYFSSANRFSKTTSALARYQGTTLGAASQTIGALVDKRLLKRTRDTIDKRRHHLSLTAKATKLIDADPMRSLVAAAFELEVEEREAIGEGLAKMLANLVRRKGGSIFGYCDDCRFLRCERRPGGEDSYRCAQADQELAAEDLDKVCINYGPPVSVD